jgi:hypothetical protein
MARSFLATGLWVRYRDRGESRGVKWGSHSSSSIASHAGEQKVRRWNINLPVVDNKHRPLSLRHHREGLGEGQVEGDY